MGKKCGKFKFFSKSLDKISIYLDKISIYLDKISIIYKYLEKSRFVSICLDDLDKNLDTSLSRLKSLDFKNLDRDKIKVDLDTLKKFVSTRRTVSISILIGIDCRDPQGYQKWIIIETCLFLNGEALDGELCRNRRFHIVDLVCIANEDGRPLSSIDKDAFLWQIFFEIQHPLH